MHLNRLTLHHFRNLHGLEIEPSPGLNLVAGQNGHGKSSLLESIHFLCLAHSPRARHDKDMAAWNQVEDGGFVIRGEGIVGENPHIQSVEYREEGVRVKVTGIGHESRRLADLLGHFLLVAFSPEDLDILRGGPRERRRFLDILLCQENPINVDLLRKYRQALRQRNAALRLRLRADDEDALLTTYEEALAGAGAEIVLRRQKLVEKLAPTARKFHLAVGETEHLDLVISPRPEASGTVESMRENLRKKLREKRAEDRENGLTSVGPHRDDLLAFLDGKSVRDFASQGQKRSAALALKLASAHLLEEASGLPPILLLDDVFAELDRGRRERFGALIMGKGQVFIATPRSEDLPFPAEKIFSLDHGRIAQG